MLCPKFCFTFYFKRSILFQMSHVSDIVKLDQVTKVLELGDVDSLPWSPWLKMPSPDNCLEIEAYHLSGVYQIRNASSKAFIQFGIGGELQDRMQSFFPKPFGRGTRNNKGKREHVLNNWKILEYRYLATESRELAATIERFVRKKKNHLFNT